MSGEIRTPSGIPLPADTTPYVLACMTQIDTMAVEHGEQIKRDFSVHGLRASTTECEKWDGGFNTNLANALELDPRLAAIPSIIAANRADNGNIVTFAAQYKELLMRHIGVAS